MNSTKTVKSQSCEKKKFDYKEHHENQTTMVLGKKYREYIQGWRKILRDAYYTRGR
jgi:hypothetical protein